MFMLKCVIFGLALSVSRADGFNIYMPNIDQIVDDSLANAFQDMPSLDPTDPNSPLHGLDHLGEHISNQVHQSLQPVYALEIKAKLQTGEGGTTIARYEPTGDVHIIINGRVGTCSGSLDERAGTCNGKIKPLDYNKETNWCFAPSRGTSGNQICLSNDGLLQFSVINDKVSCSGKLMPIQQYNSLCKARKVRYTYFANPNDPNHVKIPISNKHVNCVQKGPGICELTENIEPLRNNNIMITNTYIYK